MGKWGMTDLMLLLLLQPYAWWNIYALQALRNSKRSHRVQMLSSNRLIANASIYVVLSVGRKALARKDSNKCGLPAGFKSWFLIVNDQPELLICPYN